MPASKQQDGQDRLVLVDLLDRPKGTATKEEAHRQGLLHRAFSVFLWRTTDRGTEVLLQKRARGKCHSGGLWTNSCCSHPREGEELEEAVLRRLQEELGIQRDCISGLNEIGTYAYRTVFGCGLTEYELDHVFLASCTGEPEPDPAEAEDIAWISLDEAIEDATERPERFTSWFPGVLALTAAWLRTNVAPSQVKAAYVPGC